MKFPKARFQPGALLTGAVLFALSATGPVLGESANVTAKASPLGVSPREAVLAGYRLGPGDRVRLIVFGQHDLTGEFTINGSGFVGVPLIGQVEAGNTTAQELERKIIDKLSPDYLKNPSVTIEVVQYRPFYIVGEVRQPGSYPYVAGMTVLNAVALGGGFTYRARQRDFEIERQQNSEVRRIDAKPQTAVMPGDVIVVDERFF